MKRRDFIKTVLGSAAAVYIWQPDANLLADEGVLVNDMHAQLNPTYVDRIIYPNSCKDLQSTIVNSKNAGKSISVTGARHSMGAQQFGTDTNLLDITTMNKILDFNPEEGTIEVESGARWIKIISHLLNSQNGKKDQLGIRQKQSADLLTIGGSVSANMHGNGLNMPPFSADIESFVLINANGEKIECSRDKNSELFSLVTGGLGLFGIIYSVRIRLVPRKKIKKNVKIVKIDDLMSEFNKSLSSGAIYGIFTYATDIKSNDYLDKGILKTFIPVQTKKEIPDIPPSMQADKWLHLRYLAHSDKSKYFSDIAELNKNSDGNIYWSDTHQLGTYIYNYHGQLDKMLKQEKATDVTTEIYVPSEKLGDVMDNCRKYFKKNKTDIIFGGVGLIKKDTKSFLSYAREDYVKISFNIHTPHSKSGIKRSAEAFRFIIDQAIKYKGSYFLANHKFATASQLKDSFPSMKKFITLKMRYDPGERFQSDWYRYYRDSIMSS